MQIGTNFGSSGAHVFLGGVACLNVTHRASSPSTQVTCQLSTNCLFMFTVGSVVLALRCLRRFGFCCAETKSTICPLRSAPGTQTARNVLLIQNGGTFSSNPIFVSYAQCEQFVQLTQCCCWDSFLLTLWLSLSGNAGYYSLTASSAACLKVGCC